MIFYVFAALTIAPAIVVVASRNIVYAAFSLMLTLFGVAGLYVFLSADFLAATQVIIYVGGILVLVLFGVMLTSGKLEMRIQMQRGQVIPGAIISILIFILLTLVIRNTAWPTKEWQAAPTTKAIGEFLMKDFLLPFEAVSLLLLVALIGAAVISRRGTKLEEDD